MRAETERLPIIMLTARGEESDRVRGLSTGADDYRSGQNQTDSRSVVRDQPALTLPTLTHRYFPERTQSGH